MGKLPRAAELIAGRRRGYARREGTEDVAEARRTEGREGKAKTKRGDGEDEEQAEKVAVDRDRVGAWFPRKGVG